LSATSGPNHGTVRIAIHPLSAVIETSAVVPKTQRERFRSGGFVALQPLGGGAGVRKPNGVKPKRNEDMLWLPAQGLMHPMCHARPRRSARATSA
jgi:hypothetical protein